MSHRNRSAKRRTLGPASAGAVALTAALGGCDEPLTCQFSPDMAAPGADMRSDDQGGVDMPQQLTSFSCRCTDQFGVPLAGVSVSLGGRSATTAADGSFTLTDVPVSARVITLDGTAVEPPPDPEIAEVSLRKAEVARGVGAPGKRRYARIAEEVVLQAGVSAQREQAFVVPLSTRLEDISELLDADDVANQQIFIYGPGDSYDQAVGEARLIIAEGTKITFPAGAGKALSLTRVPPALTPGTLPAGAGSPMVVMIQPQGTTFSPPALLITPTIGQAKTGQKQSVQQLDMDTGRYSNVGSGTVVQGNSYLEVRPDAGVRVARAGFHLSLCPPVTVQGVVRRGETPVAGARVEARSIDSIEENYTQTFALRGASALTGADGRYMLSGLTACSLHLLGTTETAQGVLEVSSSERVINQGAPITQDLLLEEGTRRRFNLRVRVKNPDNMDNPFPGVAVYTSSCKANECYAETNASGEVLFRDVLGAPGGTIDVELCGNRGAPRTQQVQVPAQTPSPPACGLFQQADVQELNITTNCGSGSGSG